MNQLSIVIHDFLLMWFSRGTRRRVVDPVMDEGEMKVPRRVVTTRRPSQEKKRRNEDRMKKKTLEKRARENNVFDFQLTSLRYSVPHMLINCSMW